MYHRIPVLLLRIYLIILIKLGIGMVLRVIQILVLELLLNILEIYGVGKPYHVTKI